MEGAVLCAANRAPLTPISFLERSVMSTRTTLPSSQPEPKPSHGRGGRPKTAASALPSPSPASASGAAMWLRSSRRTSRRCASCTSAGDVIYALNSCLDAAILLRHSEARVIFIDAALLDVAQEALHLVSVAGASPPSPSSSQSSSTTD